MAETKLEDLRKWFGKGKKGDWVRVGTDGEIKGQCAREPGEGKPKCMPRSKAHSMDKKDRAASARRKRRADPMADRPGTGNKPIMVKTDKKESVDMNEASATNVNKIRAAYKDFMKKKGKNFDNIAMSLSMIANRMTQLARPDSSGRGDYKAEKIIKDEASRIQGIVNKTYNTEEGKEIRALLIKHKIYGNGSPGSAIQRLTWESVDMNEKASHDEIMKDINDFLRNNDGSGVAGMSRRIEKKYGIGPAQARSMIKTALQKVKALPKTGPKRMGRFPHMNEETAIAHQTPYGTVTAHKRDTKGMRGKQDGFKLTLKTKSGKTVDLGSHPKPTKANVMSIVKNVMQKESVDLEEKNVPTNPALWAKFKAQAKAKFDVYPSAYANGWAAKKYKAAGGSWKKESVEMPEQKTFWDVREGSCGTMNAQTKKDEKPPFTPTRKVGVKKDRFGNVVKDKNRAKHLAKLAMRGEDVELGENQTKAHLRAKSKLLGGASMMDLERAGNNIRAYAKKGGGSDKKDFDTAADYVISLGRLTDANKAGKVLQDLQFHVGMLDTDVRDKIKSMLPTGLKKKV